VAPIQLAYPDPSTPPLNPGRRIPGPTSPPDAVAQPNPGSMYRSPLAPVLEPADAAQYDLQNRTTQTTMAGRIRGDVAVGSDPSAAGAMWSTAGRSDHQQVEEEGGMRRNLRMS